jgi:hypothetical protein
MKHGRGSTDDVMRFDRVSFGGMQEKASGAKHVDKVPGAATRVSASGGNAQQGGGATELVVAQGQQGKGEEEEEEEFRFPGSERLTSLVAAWDHRAGRISAAFTDAIDRLRATAS